MRTVPFSLSISAVSFLFFFLFGVASNVINQNAIEAENRAEENLNRALEAEATLKSERKKVDSLKTVLEAHHNDRLLWLARAIYSETNKPSEMYYVGWVVRNRVDVEFNGNTTYRDVVLDPMQFSAFNHGNPRRDFYMSLDADFLDFPAYKSDNWYYALKTSKRILNADSSDRPFSPYTLYFYSEVSMPDYRPHPVWASRFSPVSVPSVEDERFRFLADFDYEDGSQQTINSSNSSYSAR